MGHLGKLKTTKINVAGSPVEPVLHLLVLSLLAEPTIIDLGQITRFSE
jgi:hypothetical protein